MLHARKLFAGTAMHYYGRGVGVEFALNKPNKSFCMAIDFDYRGWSTIGFRPVLIISTNNVYQL